MVPRAGAGGGDEGGDVRYSPDVALVAFAERGVEYVVVGGVAATMHGSAEVTLDVDMLVRRSEFEPGAAGTSPD